MTGSGTVTVSATNAKTHDHQLPIHRFYLQQQAVLKYFKGSLGLEALTSLSIAEWAVGKMQKCGGALCSTPQSLADAHY